MAGTAHHPLLPAAYHRSFYMNYDHLLRACYNALVCDLSVLVFSDSDHIIHICTILLLGKAWTIEWAQFSLADHKLRLVQVLLLRAALSTMGMESGAQTFHAAKSDLRFNEV